MGGFVPLQALGSSDLSLCFIISSARLSRVANCRSIFVLVQGC